MADLQSILLVEDNPKFIEAALNYLGNRQVWVHGAANYDAAMYGFATGNACAEKFDGVISDCFFPRNSTNDISLGEVAIQKMYATDPRAQRIDEFETYLQDYFDKEDPLVRRIIRYFGSQSEEGPLKSSIASVVKLIGGADKHAIGEVLKKDADMWFKEIKHFKDYYDELKKAMDKDPTNQPLGILVAEECQTRGVPFVLATSTYHHDALTQPIQNYCGKMGWSLIDCNQNRPDEKATPEFWARTYETLLGKMGGQR